MDVLLGLAIPADARVLDPFAGIGRVHRLGDRTVGVELEWEWANEHPRTVVANALHLPFAAGTFDAIVTSPCYGNRMADHHDAKDGSHRVTYRHTLGRELHEENAGKLQWGVSYRLFHRFAWVEAIRVLRPGGKFVLNISDHIRKGKRQPVAAWHFGMLKALGLQEVNRIKVSTPRMRRGENAGARVEGEWVNVFAKAN